jgi:hypothetical protein
MLLDRRYFKVVHCEESISIHAYGKNCGSAQNKLKIRRKPSVWKIEVDLESTPDTIIQPLQ